MSTQPTVVFSGKGSDGATGMWVVDEVNHTIELTISGTDAAGLFANGTNPLFDQFGEVVICVVEDANGDTQVDESDGTAAGTKPMTVNDAASTGFDPSDLMVAGGAAYC